jgi:ABC-type lipoprotein export system ATPase subunit
VFEVLRELVAQRRKTVVAATHDLAMASHTDREIVLMDGAIDKVVDAQR